METITQYVRNFVRIIGSGIAAAAAVSALVAGMRLTAMAAPAGKDVEAPDFDDAVAAFYRESGNLTDEEVLANARGMCSDTDVLYSGLQADTAQKVESALSVYENSKTEYMTDRINGSQPDGADREWDLQSRYAQLMIAEGTKVREVIPRYCVRSCREQEGALELDVEEWVTMGYGASEDPDAVNASAYSYSFTLCMCKDASGIWMPSGINGTDINFTWLSEGADPVTESQEAPETRYAVQTDVHAQTAGYARIAEGAFSFLVDEDRDVSGAGTAVTEAALGKDAAMDAQLYAAATGTYTYKAAAAAAYADKYWKNYNRNYREYRGVDCANFVSQCLYAGGMPRTSDWYPESVNWINVMGHIRHFKAYGAFMTASNASVSKGNPVYYDWNGNGTYDHVALCVGTNASGMPVVDAHTNNVYHVPWQMGSRGRRATIRLRTGGVQGTMTSGAKNTWQTVGTKVYFIGSDGKRVRSSFLTIGGKKYYFNAAGERAAGFFRVGQKWYYASVKTGNLLRGWQWIGGKIYYFLKDYSRISAGRHQIGSATYYFNSKGVRQISFIRIGKNWYYADKKTGKFIKGWRKISGSWYYFDKKTMVKAVGWKTINGRKCYFDANGILRKGKHG